MVEQFENNYTTQLNGSIDSSVTTLTVDAAPTTMTGEFRIRIENEIILVGAVSGLTFTGCTRGVEGTTAASHADNTAVTHVLTADSLLSLTNAEAIGVQVRQSATQTVANGTYPVPVVFDGTDDWDTHGFHNPASSNTKIIIPTGMGGLYVIVYDLTFVFNTTGERHGYLLKNGSQIVGGITRLSAANTDETTLCGTATEFLDDGDELELGAYHTRGSNLNLVPGKTSLSITRLHRAPLNENTSLDYKYNPDRPPISGTTWTDEFDDNALDGAWTWDTTPTGTVSESVYTSYLNILGGTTNTGADRYLRRAFTPGASTAFTVVLKGSVGIEGGNFGAGIGIYVMNSSDAIISGVYLATDGTTTGAKGYRYYWGSGTQWLSTILTSPTNTGGPYLRITRNASDSYTSSFSTDGITWQHLGTHSSSTTVSKVAIAHGGDTDAADVEANFDFVRVFNSVTRKIGS